MLRFLNFSSKNINTNEATAPPFECPRKFEKKLIAVYGANIMEYEEWRYARVMESNDFSIVLYNLSTIRSDTANSIKVVLTKREKIEYERERLVGKDLFYSRIRSTFTSCSGTPSIESIIQGWLPGSLAQNKPNAFLK